MTDGFLFAGFILIVGGVAAIYWPAAFIVAGILCVFISLTIAKAHSASKPYN